MIVLRKLIWSATTACVALGGVSPSHAATVSMLYSFQCQSDGSNPSGPLLAKNGRLYGLTSGGGLTNDGVLFRVAPTGVEKVIYSFPGKPGGREPHGALVDVKGTLYAATELGGDTQNANFFGLGTVTSVPFKGGNAVVYSLKRGIGTSPAGGLVRTGQTVYGLAGLGAGSANAGSVYKIIPSGRIVPVYRFQSGADGNNPIGALMKLDDSGVYYGTSLGGTAGAGTIFSVTSAGDHTILYNFKGGADGLQPTGSLVNIGGVLYGTTTDGGTSNCGTVFSVTLAGVEKVLYSFKGGTNDGCAPNPLLAVGNMLYGTTSFGGINGQNGIVFQITPSGSYQIVYSFPFSASANSALTELSGILYGATANGGARNCGTVFALNP